MKMTMRNMKEQRVKVFSICIAWLSGGRENKKACIINPRSIERKYGFSLNWRIWWIIFYIRTPLYASATYAPVTYWLSLYSARSLANALEEKKLSEITPKVIKESQVFFIQSQGSTTQPIDTMFGHSTRKWLIDTQSCRSLINRHLAAFRSFPSHNSL